MDTNLTIQLFFFGLAVPVALEAYKERERNVARIVLWSVVAIFGIMGFVWPFLDDGIPVISKSLSDLVANPLTWFVLFVGVYFIARPFWSTQKTISVLPAPELDYEPESEGTEWQDVKIKIEKLEIELSKSKETMLRQGEESEAQARKLELVTKLTSGISQQNGEFVSLILERIEAVELDQKDVQEKLEEKTKEIIRFTDSLVLKYGEAENDIKSIRHGAANLEKEFKAHLEQTQTSFATLQQREHLKLFENLIIEKSSILYDDLKSGKTLDAEGWKEWKNTHSQWRSLLSRWIETARFYTMDLETQILNTPDEKYSSEWTVKDNQLPDAEAVRIFKQYRIQQSQWEDVRQMVDKNIRSVAFFGMKESEVRANG